MEIPVEIIMAIVTGIIAAVARYFQVRANGQAAENAKLVQDSQLQQEAIIDLATIGAKAYALNADGKITQDEYNILAEEVKAKALKYGDKFGFKDDVQAILDNYRPKA